MKLDFTLEPFRKPRHLVCYALVPVVGRVRLAAWPVRRALRELQRFCPDLDPEQVLAEAKARGKP